MSILINKPGILTTLQDLGRNGFRRFGINQNGAMDRTAVRLINLLLGNDDEEPVLEMHFPAAEIVFDEGITFALGGADFSARLNGNELENWRIYLADQGSILKFTEKKLGNRAYFAVKNGFQTVSWLGSSSTNLKAHIGGFSGRRLASGDRLFFNKTNSRVFDDGNFKISNSLLPRYSKFPTVRVIAGAEFELLTALSQMDFFKETFHITSNSDRMGFRLEGKALYLLESKELLSSAVNFGTIQLLPDGKMIILMADHQTTGGYPRIGNVVSTDLPILAQLGARDKVGFHPISTAQAELLVLNFERNLNLLRAAGKFRQ